jgi:hypothetical protein
MSRIGRAQEALHRVQLSHGGASIGYRRGTSPVRTLSAIYTRPEAVGIPTSDGGTAIVERHEFTFVASALSNWFPPRKGDVITAHGQSYSVTTDATGKVWDWRDLGMKAIVVFTVLGAPA